MAQHNTASPLPREPSASVFSDSVGSGEEKRPWTKLQNDQGSSPQNITDHFCLLKKVSSPPFSVFFFCDTEFQNLPHVSERPRGKQQGRAVISLKSCPHGSQITARRNSLLLLTTETKRNDYWISTTKQEVTHQAWALLPSPEFHTQGCLLFSGRWSLCKPWPRKKPFKLCQREAASCPWLLSPGLYSAKSYLSERNLLVNIDNLVKMTLETEI